MFSTKAFLAPEAVGGLSTKKVTELVTTYVQSLHTEYYNLGALLLRVRDEGLFALWEETEYATFDDWCENHLRFHARKAQHLITIYKGIREIDPEPQVLERLSELGWVKVGQILRLKPTPEKLLHWIKKAEALSLRELQGRINLELQKLRGTADEQAAAALEDSIVRKIKFTADESAAFDKALDVIAKRVPVSSDGAKVTMMALAYLSAHVRDDEGGLAVELSYLLLGLEKAYGVKLKIIPQPIKAPIIKKKAK